MVDSSNFPGKDHGTCKCSGDRDRIKILEEQVKNLTEAVTLLLDKEIGD